MHSWTTYPIYGLIDSHRSPSSCCEVLQVRSRLAQCKGSNDEGNERLQCVCRVRSGRRGRERVELGGRDSAGGRAMEDDHDEPNK